MKIWHPLNKRLCPWDVARLHVGLYSAVLQCHGEKCIIGCPYITVLFRRPLLLRNLDTRPVSAVQRVICLRTTTQHYIYIIHRCSTLAVVPNTCDSLQYNMSALSRAVGSKFWLVRHVTGYKVVNTTSAYVC